MPSFDSIYRHHNQVLFAGQIFFRVLSEMYRLAARLKDGDIIFWVPLVK